jgi:hypothetical protein
MYYTFQIRKDQPGAIRKRVLYQSAGRYRTREDAERMASISLINSWTHIAERWVHIQEVP